MRNLRQRASGAFGGHDPATAEFGRWKVAGADHVLDKLAADAECVGGFPPPNASRGSPELGTTARGAFRVIFRPPSRNLRVADTGTVRVEAFPGPRSFP